MTEHTTELIQNMDPAEEIRKLHGDLTGLAMSSVEKAIRIGELLTEVKSALKHGEWLPWLEQNVGFSADTASNYMKVYGRRKQIPNNSEFGLTDAYKLLSKVAKEEKEDVGSEAEQDEQVGDPDIEKVAKENMKHAKDAIAILKQIKRHSYGSYDAFSKVMTFIREHNKE